MANLPPRYIPAGDVSHGVRDALRVLAEDQALSDETRIELDRIAALVKNRDALVNSKLIALDQQVQALLARLDWTEPLSTLGATGPAGPPGAAGPATYELPIIGPIAGISGAAYLAITSPIVIAGVPTANVELAFVWQAGDVGALALWRLRNRTSSVTILSGSRANPFSWTAESSTVVAAAMPSPGDEVALEVAFSAVTSGGTIDLRGPATWEVV